MQTAAAGSIFLKAIENLPPAKLTTVDIMAYFKNNTFRTFWGDLSFDEDGHRKVDSGGSRLIDALPQSSNDSLLERYFSARIQVVDAEMAAKCEICQGAAASLSTCQDHFLQPGSCGYTDFKISSTNWINKEMSVYPCDEGCFYHSLMCYACPPGKFRGQRDPDCRTCPTGRYQMYPGSSSCKECEAGAYCPISSSPPLPKEYFYLYYLNGNTSAADDELWENKDGRHCVNPYRVLNVFKTYGCRPKGVCIGIPLLEHLTELEKNKYGRQIVMEAATSNWVDNLTPDSLCAGDNTGIMCGQCKDGYTIGPLQGRRLCRPCPSSIVPVVICGSAIFVIFCILGKILSDRGYYAARKAGALSCPLLRLMGHHVIVFGLMMESVRLDADPIAGILMLPVDIIYRPFDVSSLDCLLKNVNTVTSLKLSKNFMLMLIPYGTCLIVAFHFGIDLMVTAWHCLRAIGQGIRLKAKQVSESAEKEAEPDVDFTFDVGEPDEHDAKEADAGKEEVPEPEVKHLSHEERDKNWSTLFGPGARFATSQEKFAKVTIMRNAFREWTVMLFLFFPAALRVFFRVQSCRTVSINDPASNQLLEMDILIADFDVQCKTPEHEEIYRGAYTARAIIMVGTLSLLLVLNWIYRQFMWYTSVPHREIVCFLFSGYKTERSHYEMCMWARTMCVMWAGSQDSVMLRIPLLGSLLITFLVVSLKAEPWENYCRGMLHLYDMRSSLALLSVLAAGYLCPFELDDVSDADTLLSEGMQRIIIICVVLLNYALMAHGLLQLFFFTVLTELDAILAHSQTDIDRSCILAHKFADKLFGLNPVGNIQFDGHQTICVSRLSEAERSSFAESLVETVSACIDSSSKFHTWLLDNAINEAFRRAIKARQAKWRELYNNFGTRKFALLDFKIVKFFRVSLRPPDIDTDVTGVTEVDVTLSGPGSWRMDMGKESEVWKNAVTVQEFHEALTSVAYDVMEHDPDLHKDPTETHSTAVLKPEDVAKYQDTQASTQVWQEATPLQGFEADLIEQGCLTYEKRHHALENEPSQQMWDMLAGDTQDYRQHNDLAAEEREMQKKLSTLETRIAELKNQLREAGDTDVPELEEDEPVLELEDEVEEAVVEYTETEEVRFKTFKVWIVGGKDLKNTDMLVSGVSDPYVVCRVRDDPESEWRTRHVKNSLDPVWLQAKKMKHVSRDDTLEFTIWDRDDSSPRRKLAIMKKSLAEDDYMGFAELPSDKFFQKGFTGALLVAGKKGEQWGQLEVKITIVNEDKENEEVMQYAQEALENDPELKEFFGRRAHNSQAIMETIKEGQDKSSSGQDKSSSGQDKVAPGSGKTLV